MWTASPDARLTFGNQRRSAVRRHQRKHWIAGIGFLIVEINPRIETAQHASREHRGSSWTVR